MPPHGTISIRRVNIITKNYQEKVIPLLDEFFENEVILYAGLRPTVWTHNFVTKKINVRESNDVMELDPCLSKNRLDSMLASVGDIIG